jgi:hypothetical protein
VGSKTPKIYFINLHLSFDQKGFFTYYYYFFLSVLGFELKASTFARQVLYHLSHTSCPFLALVIFQIGFFCGGLALVHHPSEKLGLQM